MSLRCGLGWHAWRVEWMGSWDDYAERDRDLGEPARNLPPVPRIPPPDGVVAVRFRACRRCGRLEKDFLRGDWLAKRQQALAEELRHLR